ncbi:Putative amine oxidase, phytoene dehydrogenase, bacterial-type, carotenoid/retinoid oxidoreductase [Septoria linicola]|uniref:Phytoene desaturase n=1 Tax=Septoria linicola TaxID=215465 RepID=A0A9Q9EI96_9PEZI|nr:putative amine oxidase, phytoene dehydrogenase, bacterial-type, carotenoid/retinoid oxidoreductase [Septoria linicola]USW50792.1 Putative amine oxidase, phytoene dehydrogenase, bacterial-type, carotenoid/retinoid oxidoreductase [Septoria linicola]
MGTSNDGRVRKTAIVIGAGVGGVSTAARLARAGFDVTVVEKNSFTGGRCSLIHHDGYRFDQGPSLLLLPGLFHRTFSELGTSLEQEGVKLLKCEPNYMIHFSDGDKFILSSDLSVMKREIERVEGKEGYTRYLEFLKESHGHYELSVREVLLRNFTGLTSMFRPEFLKHLLELHPFESIWTRASKYFWTERLRRVFTFGSMYMGMSPFDAPGTYSLLQYTELAEGIWYPVGGFHRVVEALVKVGEREGANYRLNTGVKKILLDQAGSQAKGVELEDGSVLEGDVVVNNTDLVYAYGKLLPESSYASSLKSRPGSCSSISFYWALDRKVPELEAHNIFLADEYKESFDSIFKRHLIPDEPSFYVNVPSRVDSTAAPEGKDSVVVLVPVGHLLEEDQHASQTTSTRAVSKLANGNGNISSASPADQSGLKPTEKQDWPAMVALARKTITSTIRARTGVDLENLIIHEETNDPASWKQRFNLDRGAILGLSHSFFNVLCFRPTTRARRPGPLDSQLLSLGVVGRAAEVIIDAFRGRSKDVKGLYMVGASAHPGTGVPICLAGGSLVASQICEDYGVPVPWKASVEVESKGKLDKLDRPMWLDSWEQWVSILIYLLVAIFAWLWVKFR